MTKIDIDRPVETVEGRPARFLGRVDHPHYPLVFAAECLRGKTEIVRMYSDEGTPRFGGAFYNIVNVKRRRKGYINVYDRHPNRQPHFTGPYLSRAAAERDIAVSTRTACVEIEYEVDY